MISVVVLYDTWTYLDGITEMHAYTSRCTAGCLNRASIFSSSIQIISGVGSTLRRFDLSVCRHRWNSNENVFALVFFWLWDGLLGYFSPVGVQSIAINCVCRPMSACLYVLDHISKTISKFQQIFDACCRGSVLLWQRLMFNVLPVFWMTSCLHIMARRILGDAKGYLVKVTHQGKHRAKSYLQLP